MAEREGENSTEKEEIVKYKGVRKRKWGKWVSEIRLPNSRERIWLGSYDTAEKAARAFDAALFCLRGRNVMFNFPESPPPDSILGGGGEPLTPGEIQVIASQYANSCCHQQEVQLITTTTTSPSSKSDGVILMDDGLDWSFLDMLDSHDNNGGGATTTVSDYSFISGLDNLHEDMYMASHIGGGSLDNDINYEENNQEDGNEDGNYSHQSSFLWNF